MKLYLQRKRNNVDAIAEYNELAGTVTVLKGSKLSEKITYTETFRGAKSIEKSRADTVLNGITTKDVVFKSASTAANYVTGSSTNGMIAWKDKEGRTLKELLQNKEA